MADPSPVPAWQQAIRDGCVHPTGRFVAFQPEDVEGTLPARFARQARTHADRLAVRSDRHELTYRDLSRAATSVARLLRRRRGAGPGAVAVLCEPGAPAVWSALGAMAAGKMCVPLDPTHPRARISFILDDSGAEVVLADRAHVDLARERGREVIPVEEIEAAADDADEPCSASPGEPAYLLYTSGTTGPPKGVVRSHRGLLYFQMNYANQLHICPDDRLSALRSMSVIGGVRDVYGAVLNGASLHVLDVKREGVPALAPWLREHAITIAFIGAPLFRHFAQELPGPGGFPSLRIIRLGSDTVQKADVELYRRHFPVTCVLVNGLGSTETSSACKLFIDRDTVIDTETVPVGYALPGIRILVLDPDGRPLPPGETGEIAVEGPCVSDGYWRRPDLTAATFRPSPTGDGTRMFLTGNLGRLHPDGCLEHLGRADHQVKVRGHRVELGEVERALLALPGIRQAVVVAHREPSGERRLAAYFVSARSPAPSIAAIRAGLGRRLPEHMIPADLVQLDAIPLTPLAKVDRAALPRPSRVRPELDTPFTPPATSIEEALARIWTDVLGIDHVGVHDAFLELGGDSLHASRVVSRVIETFDVDVPVRALLESPTVARMAAVVIDRRVEIELARQAADESGAGTPPGRTPPGRG